MDVSECANCGSDVLVEREGVVGCAECGCAVEEEDLVVVPSTTEVGGQWRPTYHNTSRTIAKKDFSALLDLAERKKLRPTNVDRAKTFLQRLMEREGCWRTGERGKMLAASAVYMSCCECSIACRLSELAEYLECDFKKLGSVFKSSQAIVIAEVGLRRTTMAPEVFLKSMCFSMTELDNVEQQTVRNTAERFLTVAGEHWITDGRDTATVATAAMFLATEANALMPSGSAPAKYRAAVCERMSWKISVSTVDARLRELKKVLIERGKALLSKRHTLTVKNVSQYALVLLKQLELDLKLRRRVAEERDARESSKEETGEGYGEEYEMGGSRWLKEGVDGGGEEGEDASGEGEEEQSTETAEERESVTRVMKMSDEIVPPSFKRSMRAREFRMAKVKAAKERIALASREEKEAALRTPRLNCSVEAIETVASDASSPSGRPHRRRLDKLDLEIEERLKKGVDEALLIDGHFESARALSQYDEAQLNADYLMETTLSERDIPDEDMALFLKPSALQGKRPAPGSAPGAPATKHVKKEGDELVGRPANNTVTTPCVI